MDFRLLGPVEALYDGATVALGGPKQRALLAILLLHANEALSNDRLIEMLWGEEVPETAASALRTYVTNLRRALVQSPAESRLVRRPAGYALEVAPGELDLDRFEQLTRSGTEALATGRWAEASAAFRAGLELWRGPPLADLTYEPFAQSALPRLEELRLAARENR